MSSINWLITIHGLHLITRPLSKVNLFAAFQDHPSTSRPLWDTLTAGFSRQSLRISFRCHVKKMPFHTSRWCLQVVWISDRFTFCYPSSICMSPKRPICLQCCSLQCAAFSVILIYRHHILKIISTVDSTIVHLRYLSRYTPSLAE